LLAASSIQPLALKKITAERYFIYKDGFVNFHILGYGPLSHGVRQNKKKKKCVKEDGPQKRPTQL